jgi:sugar diacid utilization regulator
MGIKRSNADAYEALFRIASKLHGEPGDLDVVLQLIVDEAAGLLSTDLAWIALAKPDGTGLYPGVIRGFYDPAFLELDISIGRGVGGVAVSEHRAIVVEDYRTYVQDTPEEVRQAGETEGVVSVICAPMFKDDVMVGALYVANRERTSFTDIDASLLSTLAAQASVAIQNRRLYDRLSSQNDLLEHAFLIHRELTEASLEGVGLEGIGNVLARLIGHRIVIEQTVCDPPLLQCPPAEPDEEDASPGIIRAIVADGRRLGSVEVLGTLELSPLQRKALEHGTTVLALELVKQRSALEVEWRLSGELLEELLECSGAISETLARRAKRLGIDVTAPRRMLAFAIDDRRSAGEGNLLALVRQTMMRRVSQIAGRSLSVKRGDEVLLALDNTLDGQATAIARDVQETAHMHGDVVMVGIGPQRHDPRESYRGAFACLALAANGGAREMVVEFDLLGPLRFLLDAPDVWQASAMIRETLAPVQDHDSTSRTPLLPTLRAFVECDAHYARTAQRLYIAVSTLKYRLSKLHGLLGRSPRDPDLRFELRLAFNLLDLIEAIGLPVSDSSRARASAADHLLTSAEPTPR